MDILPLKLVQEFEKKYPRCYEHAAFMIEGKGKDLPEWSDLCYLPISAGLAVSILYGRNNVDAGFASQLSAYSSWRIYKEMYTFDKELFCSLLSQNGDDILPVDIIKNLPYPCIFITCREPVEIYSSLSNEPLVVNGYFVYFDHDTQKDTLELRFLVISDDLITPHFIRLEEDKTISECVADTEEDFLANRKFSDKLRNTNHEWVDKYKSMVDEYNASILSQLIQPVLYLCAENAEVAENQGKKQHTQRRTDKSGKDEPIKFPKDAYREVRNWDTGYRISYAMRQHSGDYHGGQPTGGGSTKRPHARRGHWHHYWKGSGEQRGLILKWIAPMFIHADNSGDSPVTDNKV